MPRPVLKVGHLSRPVGKIRTVGIYDSFPTYEDATELFEQFGGGKYTILCISPRRMEVGYYEFEGEDRYTPVKPKRLKLKYKPRDYAPLKILVRFIENNGDPSAYLETMSVSYPDHPFCQTLNHLRISPTVTGKTQIPGVKAAFPVCRYRKGLA